MAAESYQPHFPNLHSLIRDTYRKALGADVDEEEPDSQVWVERFKGIANTLQMINNDGAFTRRSLQGLRADLKDTVGDLYSSPARANWNDEQKGLTLAHANLLSMCEGY